MPTKRQSRAVLPMKTRQNQPTTAPMMDSALFIVMSLISRDRVASATELYVVRWRALRTEGKLGTVGIAIDGTCAASKSVTSCV